MDSTTPISQEEVEFDQQETYFEALALEPTETDGAGADDSVPKAKAPKPKFDLENDPERDNPDYEPLHSEQDLLDQAIAVAGTTGEGQPADGADAASSDNWENNSGQNAWENPGFGNANPDLFAAGADSEKPKDKTPDPNNPFQTVEDEEKPEDEEDLVFSRLDDIDNDTEFEERFAKHFGVEFRRYITDTISVYRQTRPYQIYPLTDKMELVHADEDGNPIHAELLLNLNDYQPRFEIRVNREMLGEDLDSDAEEVDGSDPANPIVESLVSDSVSAKYPFKCLDTRLWGSEDETLGVQLVNLKDLRAAGGPAGNFYASLPAETVERIDEMTGSEDEDAFLCTIVHREEGVLDKKIYHDVPVWAQQTASILTNRETRFIIEGSADVEEAITTFVEHLNRKKYPYMAFHDREKKGRLRYIKDKMYPPGSVNTSSKSYDFIPIYQFQDLHEIATLSFAIVSETMHIQEEHEFNFKIGVHKLMLIPTDGVQDRAMQAGFFKVEHAPEGKKSYFPRVDDVMQISFDLEETWDMRKEDRVSQIWHAQFCAPFTVNAPRGWHPVLVSRKWNGKAGEFDSFEPEITGTATMLPEKLESALHHSDGQNVRAKLVTDEKVLLNIKWSIDRLTNEPLNEPFTNYNKRTNQVILGTRLDQLEPEDFFEGPVGELGPGVLKRMNLDKDQARAIEASRNAIGGVTFVQGPPGTGKTHLAKQALIPSLLCQETQQQSVIVCPTNLTASKIANDVDEMISEIAKTSPSVGEKYVVRVYSPAAERRYRDLQGLRAREANPKVEKKRQPRPDALVPDIDDIFQSLPDVSQSVVSLIRESRVRPTHGINDVRFTHPELSVGHYMLKFVGLIPGVPATLKFKDNHKTFVNYYKRWSAGRFLSKTQIQHFGTCGDKLFQDVLKNAAVIVSTTAGIASRRVVQVIESVTTSLIFEENPHEAEINLIPIFTARFKKNPKMMFIGDQLQLPPQATIPFTELTLSKQVEVAFMTRMIAVGHPFVLLTTNYRMAPGIADIINTQFYKGQLVNDKSVGQEFRPLQGPFKNFVNEKFQKGYLDTILLATAPDNKNKTTVNRSTKSRSNEFHINIVLQLLEPLLAIVDDDTGTESDATDSMQEESDSAEPKPKQKMKRKPPRIAIITMYEDQRMLYESAVLQMRIKGVPHMENVFVVNTDAAQGLEYDYCFNDLALSEVAGFVGDRRLNVFLSRGRDGTIVIANPQQISNMKGAQPLKNVKNHYMKKGHYYVVKSDKWIASPYFQPQELKRAAARRANPRGMITAFRGYKPATKQQPEVDETPSTPPQSPVKSESPKPDSPKPDSPKPDSPKPDSPKPKYKLDFVKPESPKSGSPEPESPKPESKESKELESDKPKPTGTSTISSSTIETNEGVLHLHLDPKALYKECFPKDYVTLPVLGDELLCVPRAAAASWNAQYGFDKIKAEELITISQNSSSADRWVEKYGNPKANNWHLEMLQEVFNEWLQEKNLNYEVQICYITDKEYVPELDEFVHWIEAGIELAPTPARPRLLLWLHSDNAALHSEGVVSHFSGLRSITGELPTNLESISQPWHSTDKMAPSKPVKIMLTPPDVKKDKSKKSEPVSGEPESGVSKVEQTEIKSQVEEAGFVVPKSDNTSKSKGKGRTVPKKTVKKAKGPWDDESWDSGRDKPAPDPKW